MLNSQGRLCLGRSSLCPVGTAENSPAIYRWVLKAALHDRSRSWACQWRHWSTTRRRPQRLPSEATISRRANDIAVGMLLRAVEERIRAHGQPRLLSVLDGKPLVVGGPSKDPD